MFICVPCVLADHHEPEVTVWYSFKQGEEPEENPYYLSFGPSEHDNFTNRLAIGCGYSHRSARASIDGIPPHKGPPRGAVMVANAIGNSLQREYRETQSVADAFEKTAEYISRIYRSGPEGNGVNWYGGTGALIVETEEELILGHLGDWCVLSATKSGEVVSHTRGYEVGDRTEIERIRPLCEGPLRLVFPRSDEKPAELEYTWSGDLFPSRLPHSVFTRLSRAFGLDFMRPALISTPEVKRIKRRDVKLGTIFTLTRRKSLAIAADIIGSAAKLGGRQSVDFVSRFVLESRNVLIERYAMLFFEPWARY